MSGRQSGREFFRQRGGYAGEPEPPPLTLAQRLWAMLKSGFKDVPTFAGTFLQGVNIVLLIKTLSGKPFGQSVAYLADHYLDFLRNKIFVVFAWAGQPVPDEYVLPLAIWATFGVIFARAWIRLNEEKAKQFGRLLNDEVWMGEFRKLKGDEKTSEYAAFLKEGQKTLTLSPLRKLAVYLVSIVFFPFFSQLVLRRDLVIDDRFWDPKAFFDARLYILAETMMVAGWVSAGALF